MFWIEKSGIEIALFPRRLVFTLFAKIWHQFDIEEQQIFFREIVEWRIFTFKSKKAFLIFYSFFSMTSLTSEAIFIIEFGSNLIVILSYSRIKFSKVHSYFRVFVIFQNMEATVICFLNNIDSVIVLNFTFVSLPWYTVSHNEMCEKELLSDLRESC